MFHPAEGLRLDLQQGSQVFLGHPLQQIRVFLHKSEKPLPGCQPVALQYFPFLPEYKMSGEYPAEFFPAGAAPV